MTYTTQCPRPIPAQYVRSHLNDVYYCSQAMSPVVYTPCPQYYSRNVAPPMTRLPSYPPPTPPLTFPTLAYVQTSGIFSMQRSRSWRSPSNLPKAGNFDHFEPNRIAATNMSKHWSTTSNSSIESNSSEGFEPIKDQKTKGSMTPEVIEEIEDHFGDRCVIDGFRGLDCVRIRVKNVNQLEHIVSFLKKADRDREILKVGIAKSFKNKGRKIRGFLCYLKLADEQAAQEFYDYYEMTVLMEFHNKLPKLEKA